MGKMTKEILQEKSNLVHNGEYEIIGEYINYGTKIDIKHKICGNIFQQSYDKHIGRKHRCSMCYDNAGKLDKNILQEKSNIKYNSEYIIKGNYTNNHTKILVEHKICGNTYEQLPSNHLKRKCFHCYGTPLKTNNEFQNESNLIHNYEYTLIGDYTGTHNEVKLLHKICNREFTQLAHWHIKGGICTYCSMSKGEKAIERFLITNNIKFGWQKSFDGCKNIHLLSFDFYLPEFNICIEFNGKQHYESIGWFGGEEALKNTILRDNIKKEFCLNNGIELFTLKYDQYNNINNILLKKLNLIYA